MEANNHSPQNDPGSKYQRLAAEYAKLKAQVSVLKTAVIERENKNAKLIEDSKSKDQQIRRSEQEMDSLNFRNQQLSCRVSVLQDTLDAGGGGRTKKIGLRLGGSGKGDQHSTHAGENQSRSSATNAGSGSILDDELQRKITENVKLHTMLEDKELEFQDEIAKLQKTVMEQEKQLRDKKISGDTDGPSTNKAHDSPSSVAAAGATTNSSATIQQQRKQRSDEKVIDDLRNEKVILELRMQDQELLLNESYIQASKLQEELIKTQEKLKHAMSSTGPKSPIASEQTPQAKGDVSKQEEVSVDRSMLLTLLKAPAIRWIDSLSEFHLHEEKRIKPSPNMISEQHAKYSSSLIDGACNLKSLREAFQAMLNEFAADVVEPKAFNKVATFLTVYCKSFQKIALCASDDVAGDDGGDFDGDRLVEVNSKISSGLTQLSNSVQLLTRECITAKSSVPSALYCKLLIQISQTMRDLADSNEELVKFYQTRFDVGIGSGFSDATKHTHSAILKSLEIVAGSSVELAKLLESYIGSVRAAEIVEEQDYEYLYDARDAADSANSYLTKLDSLKLDLVSTATPLSPTADNGATMTAVGGGAGGKVRSSGSLESQLNLAVSKINELEKTKEKLLFECQFIKNKYDRLKQLAPKQSTGGTGANEQQQDVERNERELLQNLVETRLCELSVLLQTAESKSTSLYGELVALQRRLFLAEEARTRREIELSDCKERQNQLRLEIEENTTSYENQLSSMAEHLGNMNDRLSSQSEEIEQLRSELMTKEHSKAKSK